MFLGFAVGMSSQKANTQRGIKQQSVRFCELSQMFLETVNKVLNDISLLLSFLFYNDEMNGDTRFSNELLDTATKNASSSKIVKCFAASWKFIN